MRLRHACLAAASLAAHALLSRTLLAQAAVAPVADTRIVQTTILRGTVYDSLAQKPLAAARVELVNADSVAATTRSTETDALGQFRFVGVPPGRYLIGFAHPMLDSLGIEQTARRVRIDRSATEMRVDLGLPSPRSLRISICGAAAVADSQALIIGTVRDVDTRAAVAAARVTVEWANVAFGAGGLRRITERRDYDTQETGWFALCGAPPTGTILLSATHTGDSTEALELEMPASGFLRRDLWFGIAGAIAAGDSVATKSDVSGDSIAMPTGLRRTGTGRISGMVLAAVGARPLKGARVGIRNGPSTSSDAQGAFTLTGVPTGTRMLQVRAVTYAPVDVPVDIVEGLAPLRIELVKLDAMLDTVKVRASLLMDRNEENFNRRRKQGRSVRFITAEDIAKRNPVQATDLFRTMPGIMFARDSAQYDILVQRSMTNFYNPFCRVAVFVNGIALRDPNIHDLDAMLRPSQIIGIEVYDGATAPPEFTKRNGCGSVVVWTR